MNQNIELVCCGLHTRLSPENIELTEIEQNIKV